MKQTRIFRTPVFSAVNAGEIIAAGEQLNVILNDNSLSLVNVREVALGGRKIVWDRSAMVTLPAVTSSQNATPVASDATTGNTLANELKTSINAAQVDIAAFFTAYTPLGSPTSSQNSTTAASSDGTRLTLANDLKITLNAMIVDVAEIFDAHPELGDPLSETVTTANGSDNATTQTLLNALKTAYNNLQTDVAEAFSKLDNGYYNPEGCEVAAVTSAHQIAAATDDMSDQMAPSHGDSGGPTIASSGD